MIGSAALAVDIGRQTLMNRGLQGTSDVVALDASRAIDGISNALVLSTPNVGAVWLAVRDSAARNNVSMSNLTFTLGKKHADGSFEPYDTVVTQLLIPDAVQVVAAGTTNYAF